MNKNIIQVIEKIKNFCHLKGDAEVARMIGLTKTGLYNHKVRGTIPYKALSKFCEEKHISLDWLLSDKDSQTQSTSQVSESPALPYGTARFNEICKKLEKILSEGTVDEKAKVLGIIEAVYNEIYVRKEAEQAALPEEDDARYKRTA